MSSLIDKLCLNNTNLKDHSLQLLNQFIDYIEANKIMPTILNIALTKNSKIKTDILDLTTDLVMCQKLNVSTKVYAKLFCKFLPINDNTIRSKALVLFNEIYSNIGDELWNMIEVSEKDKQYLEENLYKEDNNEEEEEEENEENKNEENEKNTPEDSNSSNKNLNKLSEEQNNNINTDNEVNNEEPASSSKNYTTENISTENETQENNNSENNTIKNNTNKQNGSLAKEDLFETLDNLSSADPTEKLNTIILIHEILCGKYNENKNILIANIDHIINKFKNETHQLFYSKDIKTIPIKFY